MEVYFQGGARMAFCWAESLSNRETVDARAGGARGEKPKSA